MAPFVPTDEQSAILEHEVGHHARILAGPGTGKSATVIAWLSHHNPDRTRLLTFTRAATGELVQKLREREDIQIDKPSTIHAFCIAVLLRNGGVGEFPRPFRMADDWETDNIVEPTLARRLQIGRRDVVKLFSELAANWESLNPAESANVSAAARARFMGGWREHRQILGYGLLSELPFALRSALRDHPDLEGVDYRVLVVDEYQDLNACDLDVLRRIAARGCAIIAAGDDDQSIYSFRKAHPQGIRDFLDDYPGAAAYPLTLTRRCGRRIVEWANYVIQGDPDRPAERGELQCTEDAVDGEVGLLGFASNASEARGIARLIHHLIADCGLPADEILILVRSDHNGLFTQPIKAALLQRNIPFSDPSEIREILALEENRRALSLLRLRINREDSLAWASLLHLTAGVGETFFNYVYDRARAGGVTFGSALLASHQIEFPELSSALVTRARRLVESTIARIDNIQLPEEQPEAGWGQWISELFNDQGDVRISEGLRNLLVKIDERVEETDDLDRYLGQIAPVAKDIALEKNGRVRIMTLAGSKGLTVKATIIAGLETGLIPMDECDPSEERRLLYVGMTRSEQFLFGTWARTRRGPTARMGRVLPHDRRQLSQLINGGPVDPEDGTAYLDRISTV
jgi:DNA helicase II / ATP-dependent DNA helicase PcrA